MRRFKFPAPFRHEHAPIKNANEIIRAKQSLGQKAADWIADRVGSWKFIISQSLLLAVWVVVNVTAWVRHWDPYPFILMNLVLSLQAAYTAPMIMMSQNRKAERDRIEAHLDYEVNLKSETELRVVLENLEAQNLAIADLQTMFQTLLDQTKPTSTAP